MARYMIEFAHNVDDYIKALSEADEYAYEFLSGTYWSCLSEKRAGWTIVEAATESDALNMVPAALQDKVSITEVHELTPELIEWLQQKAA